MDFWISGFHSGFLDFSLWLERLHDRVDKIRADSTWQHVHVQTFCMWDQVSEVDVLVHTKSRQSCACYIAAMF